MTTPRRRSSNALRMTDQSRWKLDSSDAGRHVWFYDRPLDSTAYETVWGEDQNGTREKEQTVEAKYALGLPLPTVSGLTSPEGNPYEAASKGYEFYKRLQSPDGHYSGEYGGKRPPRVHAFLYIF